MSMFEYYMDSMLMESSGYDSDIEETVESWIESVEPIECTDNDPFDAMMRIANECVMNHNAIVNAVAMDELKYLRENGEEKKEDKGDKIGIVTKIRKALMNFLAKLQGVVTSVVRKIQEWNKADAAFLKVSRKKLEEIKSGKITGKFYSFDKVGENLAKWFEPINFKTDSTLKDFADVSLGRSDSNKAEELTKKWNKEKPTIMAEMRKHIFKAAGITSNAASDNAAFKKDLESQTRGNIISEINLSGLKKYIDIIEKTAELKKAVRTAYDGAKANVTDMLKQIAAVERSIKGDKDGSKINKQYLGALSNICSSMTALTSTTYHVAIKMVCQQNRQAKAICVAALRKGSNKEEKSNNESASFLEAVELI